METVSPVAEDGLEFLIFLPPSLKCWEHRPLPLSLLLNAVLLGLLSSGCDEIQCSAVYAGALPLAHYVNSRSFSVYEENRISFIR